MNPFYPNLLSPLKVRKVFYKNRMGFPRAVPNIVSGALSGDVLESLGLYCAQLARNGAAVVCVNTPTWDNPLSRPLPPGARPPFSDKSYDMKQPNVQLAMCRVVEAIHNYGAAACMSMMALEPAGWDINELDEATIDGMADFFAEKARFYQTLGFDQICFYMSYNASILARSLSPVKNQRTDEYGGDMVGRAQLSKKIFQRCREKCPDLILEAQISGEEDGPGGYTVEDFVTYIKTVEDVLDVVQIRACDGDLSHPLGLTSVKEEPLTLKYAQALKDAGCNIVVAPVGGYQDPDLNEKFLAEGKCDFIYMARAFICDDQYGKKIREGRGEDIIPCLRCNGCHTRPNNPEAGCYVNPKMVMGLDHNWVEPAPEKVKKVAVIGGGPAGMKAALVAAERGHRVTLFEKKALGGQLLHADHAGFKWPLRDYKDYLIRQVMKSSVEVRMTEATPEMIREEQYEAVILAAGAVHKLPEIPGAAESKNVYLPLQVYGHEAELGRRVVVIGGSETGVETALYLAMAGHDVTVLTRKNRLAHDAQPVHFRESFVRQWESMENFHYVLSAATTAISDGAVTYTDAEGSHTVECDAVVACGGLNSLNDRALEFAAATDYFRVVGDCKAVKDVKFATKSAYTAAALI